MQHSRYPSTYYRVSQKAVIRNPSGEVLVVKEGSSDTWNLPGGGWDHGESEHESLARELYEEIGYQGEFTAQPFATHVTWLESKQAWLLWIVYDVTVSGYDLKAGADVSEVAFIDPQSLPETSTSHAEQWIRTNL